MLVYLESVSVRETRKGMSWITLRLENFGDGAGFVFACSTNSVIDDKGTESRMNRPAGIRLQSRTERRQCHRVNAAADGQACRISVTFFTPSRFWQGIPMFSVSSWVELTVEDEGTVLDDLLSV